LPGKIALSLACGDYEIVRPLKEGLVEPEGIELTILTGQDSNTRHWRFLRNREYDVAELSCSSYAVARDQGLPFTAIPVFLHRRFRHGFIYINAGKGIRSPRDLLGRKIGLKQFQSTAIVWMRGILEHEYGVPHNAVEWYPELDESVEFEPPPGVTINRLPHDKSVVSMLVSGELDAALHPELIRPIREHDPRVGRLFADYRSEEESFYRKTGIFRSCICSASGRSWSRRIPGSRPRSTALSTRPRISRCGACATRPWCRSSSMAKPGRSSSRCSAPILGNTAWARATGTISTR